MREFAASIRCVQNAGPFFENLIRAGSFRDNLPVDNRKNHENRFDKTLELSATEAEELINQ